ncbi:MAG TPA: family 31 carbohydrate-binding protein [Steroidobacteraceae bacterium]|nr:family 31 carbohydrate-binding protein [Steroidobacteraceae bacterium]
MHLQSFVRNLPVLAAAAVLAGGAASTAGAAVFAPPAGSKLIVVGQDVNSIADYVSSVGLTPAGVTGYTGITDLGGLTTNGDWGAGLNNAQTLVNTYQNSIAVIGVSLNGQTVAFANGAYDANLDQLINTLKGWNRPVLLRWGYEVEGTWNGHPASEFKTGWIKVWNRIRALNAQNHIAMVWQTATYCPDGISVSQALNWYPGDQYVDWMGLSYFAPQDCSWVEVNDMIALARSHAKPLLIAESTPQRYDIGALTYSTDAAFGANKQSRTAQQIWNEWFANLFTVINANADVVRALAYINADWDSQWRWNPTDGIGAAEGYWGDSRVQAQSTVRTNWISEITSNNWLGGSGTLFGQLGFGSGSGDTTAPTVPANLQATATSSSSIALTWSASTDNVGVVRYDIYRNGSGSALASPSGTSHTDSGLAASTLYSYTVRACDAAGNCSALSTAASATTQAPPSGSGSFGIDGAGKLYHVDGGWSASFNYLCLNDDCRPGTRTGGRFERAVSVTPGSSYTIEFKVQDSAAPGGQCLTGAKQITYAAGGASVSSPCAGGGPPPPAPAVPTGLTVGSATTSSLVVSWNASSGTAHYDVYRNGTIVASPTGTTTADTGLSAGTSYSYTVRACNSAGSCSAQSAAVSGTTTGSPPPTGGPFGIDGAGKLYHVDRGWTASFAYLCLNGDCRSATRVNGRFERAVTVSPGVQYQIEFKVQDNAIGQCLTGSLPITYAAGGASIASGCAP